MDTQTLIDKQLIRDLQNYYSYSIDSGEYDNLDNVPAGPVSRRNESCRLKRSCILMIRIFVEKMIENSPKYCDEIPLTQF